MKLLKSSIACLVVVLSLFTINTKAQLPAGLNDLTELSKEITQLVNSANGEFGQLQGAVARTGRNPQTGKEIKVKIAVIGGIIGQLGDLTNDLAKKAVNTGNKELLADIGMLSQQVADIEGLVKIMNELLLKNPELLEAVVDEGRNQIKALAKTGTCIRVEVQTIRSNK